MTAPLTRPSGAPPPPATCRDCGGPLDPSDPPDVHVGAMACIRVLRQRVLGLQHAVDAARGKGAHADALASEAEAFSRRMRAATRTAGDWMGADTELLALDAALAAYRAEHPKAVEG